MRKYLLLITLVAFFATCGHPVNNPQPVEEDPWASVPDLALPLKSLTPLSLFETNVENRCDALEGFLRAFVQEHTKDVIIRNVSCAALWAYRLEAILRHDDDFAEVTLEAPFRFAEESSSGHFYPRVLVNGRGYARSLYDMAPLLRLHSNFRFLHATLAAFVEDKGNPELFFGLTRDDFATAWVRWFNENGISFPGRDEQGDETCITLKIQLTAETGLTGTASILEIPAGFLQSQGGEFFGCSDDNCLLELPIRYEFNSTNFGLTAMDSVRDMIVTHSRILNSLPPQP